MKVVMIVGIAGSYKTKLLLISISYSTSLGIIYTSKPSIFPTSLEDLLKQNADGHMVLLNKNKLDERSRHKLENDTLLFRKILHISFQQYFRTLPKRLSDYFPPKEWTHIMFRVPFRKKKNGYSQGESYTIGL
ncbi:hypothetical protein JTB14_021646 [Gonioctena quinquepunctata]|nr:hypothetical protein JTB14_021646 [Gonioctena quinquepunctata]